MTATGPDVALHVVMRLGPGAQRERRSYLTGIVVALHLAKRHPDVAGPLLEAIERLARAGGWTRSPRDIAADDQNQAATWDAIAELVRELGGAA